MATIRVPLSETEEAYIALILDVHKAAIAQAEQLKQKADETKNQRFAPVMKAHQIPDGTNVSVLGRKGDDPAFLVYEAPDIPEAP